MGRKDPVLAEALDSVAEAIAFSPHDFDEHTRLAWIYGVMSGWGYALTEVAAKHGWDADTVNRLRRYRRAVARATSKLEGKTHPVGAPDVPNMIGRKGTIKP